MSYIIRIDISAHCRRFGTVRTFIRSVCAPNVLKVVVIVVVNAKYGIVQHKRARTKMNTTLKGLIIYYQEINAIIDAALNIICSQCITIVHIDLKPLTNNNKPVLGSSDSNINLVSVSDEYQVSIALV